MRHRLAATCALMLAAALSAGCGVGFTLYAKQVADRPPNADPRHFDEAADGYLAEAADRFGLMALFAEVVYRRDIKEEERDGQGCGYLQPDAAPGRRSFGMPYDGAGGPGRSRWERWVPGPALPQVKACEDLDGLYYETYVHVGADNRIDEAVIAFRGTENRAGQTWRDWATNVQAFIGVEPTQYVLASERLVPLLQALAPLLTTRPDVATSGRIYAVGHSLGGGLAQQAGYLSKQVAEVYTFNTSPVTNWSKLAIHGRIGNAFPKIHRVYNGGEILEKLRFVTTSVTEARYGRHDLGLQLGERSSFGGHDMKIFTCVFARVLARGPKDGQAGHQYPLPYAREVVLRTKGEPGQHLICADDQAKPG